MPKLNPNEAPKGYVAVECKDDQRNCDGCDAFPLLYGSCKYKCTPVARKDKCWVIFKRKPTKPTRKPREWMAWAAIWKDREDNHPIIYTGSRSSAQRNFNPDARVIRVKIMEVV